MAIDIHALFHQIAASSTLADSVRLLADGLAKELPELLELVPHPDNPDRKVSAAALLGEALTRNTSHVAVDPRHPGYARAHRMLTETPELDKAAHIHDIETRLARKTAEHAAERAAHEVEKAAHAALKAKRAKAEAAEESG